MTERHRIAIFGGGKVGTAMSLEMGHNVPVIHRGEDCLCDIACICWPAHAIKDFTVAHPLAAQGYKVAFCNGAWAEEDSADHAGICYVRASNLGDRAESGRKTWAVGFEELATILTSHGLGVVHSRSRHIEKVWGKALYLIPLALTIADLEREGTTLSTKEVVETEQYVEWYCIVREEAEEVVGEEGIASQEARVRFLIEHTPRNWRPLLSVEELAYFRAKLTI